MPLPPRPALMRSLIATACLTTLGAAAARFRAGGRCDRSFGRGGRKVLDFGRLSVAEDVAVRDDGRIVIAGSSRDNLQVTEALAARLRPGGGLDRSFAARGTFRRQYARGGHVFTAFGSDDAAFRGIASGGGTLLAAGSRVGFFSNETRGLVARYTAPRRR